MSESGPQRLGPNRVPCGPVAGTRWTVLRHMAPAQRRRGKLLWQHRVLCRCVCGETRAIWEFDILTGRATGCASKRCWRQHALPDLVEFTQIQTRIEVELDRIDEIIERINRFEADAALVRSRMRCRVPGKKWRESA